MLLWNDLCTLIAGSAIKSRDLRISTKLLRLSWGVNVHSDKPIFYGRSLVSKRKRLELEGIFRDFMFWGYGLCRCRCVVTSCVFLLVILLWIVTFQKLEDYCFKYFKPLFKFSLPTDRQTHKLRLAPSILTT